MGGVGTNGKVGINNRKMGNGESYTIKVFSDVFINVFHSLLTGANQPTITDDQKDVLDVAFVV